MNRSLVGPKNSQVLPLVDTTDAGALSRHSLCTSVFGGVLIASAQSLLVLPVFYVVVESARESFIFHKKVWHDNKL